GSVRHRRVRSQLRPRRRAHRRVRPVPRARGRHAGEEPGPHRSRAPRRVPHVVRQAYGRPMTQHSAHSAFDRGVALSRMAEEDFDLLVIGGGITGAGVAVDAATRGLRTALVERGDFASGTSSKSSKLVHGGLRYLQQREVGLVYEGLAERQVALRNAPHLVRVLPFLIPVLTKDGVISRRLARALGGALWMYDLTGGLRIGKRHKRVSSDQAVTHMP